MPQGAFVHFVLDASGSASAGMFEGIIAAMHVLLFDIDGTLMNAGRAGQAAMEAALVDYFGVARPTDDIPMAGRTDFAITRDLLAYHGLQLDEWQRDRFLSSYFQRLPHHLANSDSTLLPGVTSLLELLTAREDVALGLLTGNFAEGARLKLERFALTHHFTFGSYGDSHASRDDVAREALRQVRDRHADVPIDRIWIIGDTPADIQCARAIGAKVLAVATGVFTVADLAPHQPDVLRTTLANPDTWYQTLWPH